MEKPLVLVQGITGREGTFWTEQMLAYGTQVVAGVTPGRGGSFLHGVPVYDSVQDACSRHRADVALLFVPPLAVEQAATDAIACGVPWIVILTEHVPVQDTMRIYALAQGAGARIIGPNSPGVVVPGRWSVGIMPAALPRMFRPGTIGVASRSGSLGALVCVSLVAAGLGQSAFLGLGGDPVVGTTFVNALEMLECDPATKTVVLIGELGGAMEEEAASYLPRMSKSVVALIAGRSAPEGRRLGHAGAIISGKVGHAVSKIDALRSAGARIAHIPSEIPILIHQDAGA